MMVDFGGRWPSRGGGVRGQRRRHAAGHVLAKGRHDSSGVGGDGERDGGERGGGEQGDGERSSGERGNGERDGGERGAGGGRTGGQEARVAVSSSRGSGVRCRRD